MAESKPRVSNRGANAAPPPEAPAEPLTRDCRRLPRRDWCAWSGRQPKILNEQAVRYGLPIAGPTIDLPSLARWLHDFLAAHAGALARGDPAHDDAAALALRERTAKTRRIELALERDLGLWLPREEVHDGLSRISAVLRACGESLQRQCGAAAVKILNDALDDAQRELDRLASADGPTGIEPSAAG
jgi:hypothetical protein